MNLEDSLYAALASLSRHKLRAALTMLGIVFGVGAVIAMLSIGAGAEKQALESIARLGLNNILVRSEEPSEEEVSEVRAKSSGVSFRDAKSIGDAVPGVAGTSPKVQVTTHTILSGTNRVEANVFGVLDSHARLVNLALASGRFLDPLDVRRHEQVAVIGDQVRTELFGFKPAVGHHLKINEIWFEVIGILATGNSTGGETFQGVQVGSSDSAIYIPATTALRKFDRRPTDSQLTEIIVELESSETATTTANLIEGLLNQLHAGQSDYQLVVPEALLEESRRTQRIFNIVMGCIAGISLLVGGIGIMNIMLASVLERTKEIGIRRAVGAKKHDIMVQFLVESFALAALGGIAGVLMGISIAKIVAISAGWPTIVQVWAVVLATGVALTVGLASGVYPAVRAANLDPIDALRWD